MKDMDYSFFYGSALVRLVHDSRTFGVKLYNGNNCYLVNKKNIIYLKHSAKRLSPWSFTFLPEHIAEITKICNQGKTIFTVLICNDDGICCLDYSELSQVIFFGNIGQTKSIRISRSPREKYAVTGSDGKLNHKIGDSEFPEKVLA
jgi:hypothetical protein